MTIEWMMNWSWSWLKKDVTSAEICCIVIFQMSYFWNWLSGIMLDGIEKSISACISTFFSPWIPCQLFFGGAFLEIGSGKWYKTGGNWLWLLASYGWLSSDMGLWIALFIAWVLCRFVLLAWSAWLCYYVWIRSKLTGIILWIGQISCRKASK